MIRQKRDFAGPFLTTDLVLVELANCLSQPPYHEAVVAVIEEIKSDDNTKVVPFDSEGMEKALVLYKERPDKARGLVDCSSLCTEFLHIIMRLKENMRDFFARYVKEHFSDAKVYLFGSRVDDNGKGGDIDILIISREKLSFSNLSFMRTNFYKKFGEQKLDVVNFSVTDKEPFKEIALHHAIEL